MEVKGEALISIPLFILKKFGKKGYDQWYSILPEPSKKIFQSPIDKTAWFPLECAMVEPTLLMCETFFNKSLRGAWECGRYSAEYGLKGIYKVLVKMSSPQILIRKAGPILLNYYRTGKVEVTDVSPNHVVVCISEFPEMKKVMEYRIAGWMERALEICGCLNVTVKIVKSLADHDFCTEYSITWRKKL